MCHILTIHERDTTHAHVLATLVFPHEPLPGWYLFAFWIEAASDHSTCARNESTSYCCCWPLVDPAAAWWGAVGI